MQVFVQNLIYFVTCEELSRGRNDEEMATAILTGGVKVIQFRDKYASRSVLLKKAFRLRKLTSRYGALLLINDDPEVALEVGADGVHLGQKDYPVSEVRHLEYQGRSGKKLIIGLSTHNQDEVEDALTLPVDYINLGPIFPTQTKENSYPPIVKLNENENNMEHDFFQLQKMIDLCHQGCLPFTVMGGIKKKNIRPLAELGVRHFAMITELTHHPSPREHTIHLISLTKKAIRNNQTSSLNQKKTYKSYLG